MRGIQTTCSICGASGEIFGCPGYYDVCTDKDACRRRAVYNQKQEIKRLEKKNEELQKELTLIKSAGQ